MHKKLVDLFKENESFDITGYIKVNSKDNLIGIIKQIYSFNFIKFSFLKLNYQFIDEYIDLFNKNNLDNLYLIKEFLLEITKKDILNESNQKYCQLILKKLYQAIHDTGVYLIKENTISGQNCIKLFMNDIYFSKCNYEQFNYIMSYITNDKIEELLSFQNSISFCWANINNQFENITEFKTTCLDINFLIKIAFMLEISYDKLLFRLNQQLLCLY